MSETRERPAVLWIAGIFIILLGLLGSCGGVFGIGNLLAQEAVMDAQREMLESSGQSDAQMAQQIALQDATLELTERWKVPMIAGNLLNLLCSVLLMVAGALLFRWSPLTFKVLIAACIGSVLADLLLGGLGIYIQQQTMDLMSEMMATSGNPEADQLVEGFMQAGATSGICFALGWLFAKLGVYAGSLWAVGSPKQRALFTKA